MGGREGQYRRNENAGKKNGAVGARIACVSVGNSRRLTSRASAAAGLRVACNLEGYQRYTRIQAKETLKSYVSARGQIKFAVSAPAKLAALSARSLSTRVYHNRDAFICEGVKWSGPDVSVRVRPASTNLCLD